MSSQILFFFSALGVFNALLLSGYLWFKAPLVAGNRFLTLLLLMLSLRIGKSVFFYFSPDLHKLYLQVGLSACLLIGPCLYLFCLSTTRRKSLTKKLLGHVLLPFIAIVLIGILYPYQHYSELWGGTLYKLVNYVWLFYIALSAAVLYPTLKTTFTAKRSLNQPDRLSLSVVIANAMIWLSYATGSYTSYISGALSFSFILYVSIVLAVSAKREHAASQLKNEARYQQKLDADDVDAMTQKLTRLMQDEQLFLNANLTLVQLAKKLGTNTSRLSQLFNDNLQTSFPTYLNTLRIAHAKALLCTDKKLSTEHIADLCGFNSLSTFYSAFKKITGTTPAQFRQHAHQYQENA
ncbi:MAG TPA: helix-turn-helix transcriptional regulator [Rheinheimera sp.]|nr:helix-turn-helix transcriptional regulator [Rheinheimera sp.]